MSGIIRSKVKKMPEEEKLIQLTLTQDEALILGAITGLGISSLKHDKEKTRSIRILVTVLTALRPEAQKSLASKMVVIGNLSKKYAVEEWLKVK